MKRTGFLVRSFKYFTVSFTTMLVISEGALLYRLFVAPSPWTFAAVILHPYLTPLLFHRLHSAFVPLREGPSYFGIAYYSPWLTTHRFQLLFITFPALEKVLILLGLFSPWLRAWGSKVGRGVIWTPHVKVLDRTHLHVGDGVVVGDRVYLSAHLVRPAGEKKFLLYFRRITIGDGAFVGAWSRFAPGAAVGAGTMVPLLTDLSVNQHVDNETFAEAKRKRRAAA